MTLRRARVTIVAVKKTVRITYSAGESVALVIQHAKRMRRIILSSVACSAPRRLIKRRDFRKEIY